MTSHGRRRRGRSLRRPSFPSVIVRPAVLAPWAVLAMPLTLFVHAVLVGQDPDRQWARSLLAGTSGAAASPDSHSTPGINPA
jgi:hypothetical protein